MGSCSFGDPELICSAMGKAMGKDRVRNAGQVMRFAGQVPSRARVWGGGQGGAIKALWRPPGRPAACSASGFGYVRMSSEGFRRQPAALAVRGEGCDKGGKIKASGATRIAGR